MKTERERFMAFVSPEPNTGCWLWTGTGPSNGYGLFRITEGGRRKEYAHRIAYELFVRPIPAGRELDHLCRVRCCVNPAHLEAVTHTENVRRGESPWARNARKTHCPKGHPYSIPNLYMYGTHRFCKTCVNNASRDVWRRQKEAKNGCI